jgi:PAS domain S-box-containing protein
MPRRKPAAAASSDGFQLLFANNPLPMWVYDLETLQFLEVNEAAVAQYGYSRREFLAMRITDIRPSEDLARLREHIAPRRPPLQRSGDWRHTRKDGHIIEVEITSHTLTYAGRSAALVVAQDVTQRKKAEAELRRLAAIVESSDDAILSVALDGTVLTWNAGAEKVYGYPAEEALGRSVYTFVPPEGRAALSQIYERVQRGEYVPSFEAVRVKKDGTLIHVAVTLSPVKDGEGQIIAISGIIRDITEQKRAAEALRESDARLRSIFEGAPVGLFRSTLDGRILEANPAFLNMVGYPDRETLLATNAVNLYANPEQRKRWAALLMRDGVVASFESEFRRLDGAIIWVRESARVVCDASGRILHFEGAVEDITLQKRVDEESRKAREAQRANEAKSEFLSRMSHELRTPLNAILGFAELLALGSLSAEQHESVSLILEAGRHLLELINESLDMARIEAGRLTISLEPVSLGGLVQDTLDLIRPLAAKAKVQLTAEASSTSDRHILADRQRIRQVLLNLLSNAVKYNHVGGTVVLSCELTSEGRLRINVSDTGPGIPPEQLAHLFTPFERLGAEQAGVEGTGLGLVLTKRLVEAMGGHLGVESRVGRGSTFWVDLALAEGPVERQKQERPA